MPNEFYISKRNGEWKGTAVMKEAYDSLPDGNYLATIRSTKNRTNPQNDYLHGVMLPLVRDGLRDLGWNHIRTIEDAKDYLKDKFLMVDVPNVQTGEVIKVRKKTSELTTVEFNEFKEVVQQWAVEWLNVNIPDPGEQLEIESFS